jgi:hypothetical protein
MEKYRHLKLKFIPGEFKYVLCNETTSLADVVRTIQETAPDEPFFLSSGHEDRSVLISSKINLPYEKEEKGWNCFRIIGDMPFGSVQGLIATVSQTLKDNGIGVCIMSSFLTDFFFIRSKYVNLAKQSLEKEGWVLV